jgi:hypothetical protein
MTTMRPLARISILFALALVPVALWAQPASACPVATQVRTFVLGATDSHVYVMEVEQHRDGDFESGRDWHEVTPSLVALEFGDDGTVSARGVVHVGTTEKLEGGTERDWLLDTWDRYAERAATMSGFVAASITARRKCDYLSACGAYSMVAGGIRDGGGTTRALSITDSFAGGSAPVGDFSGWGIDELETLEVDGRTYARVTVGVGHDMDPCTVLADPTGCAAMRSDREVASPGSLRDAVEHKRALHHGREWDVLLLLR